MCLRAYFDHGVTTGTVGEGSSVTLFTGTTVALITVADGRIVGFAGL
jgi:hypothetical protein